MRENFNQNLHNIKLSPIIAISEEARRIAPAYEERTGRPFIYFQRGEIDQSTFKEISDEVKSALDKGKTKYPISGGSKEVKEALLRKLESYNKIEGLSLDDVVVTSGGQEALNMSIDIFRNGRGAGFSPIWSVLVENFIPYSGIDFTEIPFNEDFSIDFRNLEKTLSSGLDFFYLNNPHNPTGKVFTEEELTIVGRLCEKNNVCIISDEAYDYIIFDGKKHISIASLPEMKNYEDIFTAYTFSKTFSMTGFRLGYLVTKNKIASNLIKNMQYTHTAGVPTMIQEAAVNAFSLKDQIENMVHVFEERRNKLYDSLTKINGLKVSKPEGAFYMFPDFSKLISGCDNQDGKYIYRKLLENGICVIPGKDFTKTPYFNNFTRISFSMASLPMIEEGVRRMQEIFQ